MRHVVQSNLPLKYPITLEECRRNGSPHRLFENQVPPLDFEIGLSGFTSLSGRVDVVERRVRELQKLEERGYVKKNREFSKYQLATGAGINPARYGTTEWKFHSEVAYREGIPYAFHLGNIEGPHGNLLVETVQRGAKRDVYGVLNIGCGSVGFQHRNIENAGVKEITYVDDNSHLPLTGLKQLQAYLEKFGAQGIQRRFLDLDKNNTEAVQANIPAGSIGTVIRTGVFEMTRGELAGLRHVMAPDGEMFVANSIERQPIGEFLNAVEPVFEEIEVHVGYERYALICGRPKAA